MKIFKYSVFNIRILKINIKILKFKLEMKKILFCIFTMIFACCFVSCGQHTEKQNSEKDSTSQDSTDTATVDSAAIADSFSTAVSK